MAKKFVLTSNSETKPRIQSIDLLRGAVMIIMALDHCRDFFHLGSLNGNDPLDFKTTHASLFLTRWITHFCAPVFVFLAGCSIYFVRQKRTLNQTSVFLLTRGLWLILLEVTVINWGWMGNLSYAFTGLQVIWVIGWSMIIMSLLVRLPDAIRLILGILLVCGHNILDGFDSGIMENFNEVLWSVLHVQHGFVIDDSHYLVVIYPLIPWLGLMILGFSLGRLYQTGYPSIKRRRIQLQLGSACILLFILLRSGNFYGDSHHWSQQANGVFSVLSFVDTTKYPPSLLYALMTIGPGLIILSIVEKWKGKFITMVSVFGRVPFFYYILHIYLIHLVAFVIFFSTGYHWSDMEPRSLFGFPKGFGVNLGMVYLLWAGVIVTLYFPCRWYNNYKSKHNHWWLSYL